MYRSLLVSLLLIGAVTTLVTQTGASFVDSGASEAYLVEGHAYHEMCLLLNPGAAPVSQRGILL